MKLIPLFVALTAAAFASLAQAHENAPTGPNGGEVRDAGKYHLELVVKESAVALYVTDDKDRKVSTKGAAATATVLSGKDKATVKLEPAGENMLAGTTRGQSSADMKVVVSLTPAGQPSVQARFTPFATAKPAAKAAKGTK